MKANTVSIILTAIGGALAVPLVVDAPGPGLALREAHGNNQNAIDAREVTSDIFKRNPDTPFNLGGSTEKRSNGLGGKNTMDARRIKDMFLAGDGNPEEPSNSLSGKNTMDARRIKDMFLAGDGNPEEPSNSLSGKNAIDARRIKDMFLAGDGNHEGTILSSPEKRYLGFNTAHQEHGHLPGGSPGLPGLAKLLSLSQSNYFSQLLRNSMAGSSRH